MTLIVAILFAAVLALACLALWSVMVFRLGQQYGAGLVEEEGKAGVEVSQFISPQATVIPGPNKPGVAAAATNGSGNGGGKRIRRVSE